MCRKGDPNSAPLLSVNEHSDINDYNTMSGEGLETPPSNDPLSEPLISNINYKNQKNDA